MSVSCLFIGDPHFRVGDVERTNVMVTKIISEANKLNPDFILVAGDTFNDFENIKISVIRRVVDFIKELKNIAPVIMLVGNHERPNNSEFCTKNHSLAAFEEWENVLVVESPKQETFNNLLFTFVPYTPSGKLLDALAILGPKSTWYNSVAIFGHHDIRGTKTKNSICVDGDEWPEDYPFFFSGHNHEYQSIGDNIHYPGNPMQLNYGDSTDKSISVLTFTKNSWEEERIYINVPCKIKIMVNVDEFMVMERPEYDVVKITIKDSFEKINTISKCKKIREYIKNGFIIDKIYVDAEESESKFEDNADLELIERKVDDYDKLLYERVSKYDENIREQFSYLFPELVDKYK